MNAAIEGAQVRTGQDGKPPRNGGEYGIVSAAGLFFTLITVPVILLVRWALEKVPSVEY